MCSNPLVSVIVPVFNIPNRFLQQCLETLAKQTFQSMEVIIVDDSSSLEGNAELCDEAARKNQRFRVIHLKTNKGVSAARNRGIREAIGDWLTFVDPDDWIENDMVEQLTQRIGFADTDIVVCDCCVEYDRQTIKNSFYNIPESNFIWDEALRKKTLLQILGRNKEYFPSEIAIGVPWAKLYRRSFILQHNVYFNEKLNRMEDNIFNLYLFSIANKVEYLPKTLYHYRRSGNSASSRFSPNVISDFTDVLECTDFFLQNINADQDLWQGYYARTIQSFNSFFNLYFFNPGNTDDYSCRKTKVLALLAQNPYNEALRKLNFHKADRSIAFLAILLKSKQIRILSLIIIIKRYVTSIFKDRF
jgi:glycosyltransferase involved in cell wall biosynthesis